jgi:hypothetical protein
MIKISLKAKNNETTDGFVSKFDAFFTLLFHNHTFPIIWKTENWQGQH